jgi:hypothetical protein
MFGLTFGLEAKLQREPIDWRRHYNMGKETQDWLGDMYLKYAEDKYEDLNPKAYASRCKLNTKMVESKKAKKHVVIASESEMEDGNVRGITDIADLTDIAVDTIEDLMEQHMLESYKEQMKDIEEYIILEEKVSVLGLIRKAINGNKRATLRIRELCDTYDGLGDLVKVAIKEMV